MALALLELFGATREITLEVLLGVVGDTRKGDLTEEPIAETRVGCLDPGEQIISLDPEKVREVVVEVVDANVDLASETLLGDRGELGERSKACSGWRTAC